MARDSSTRIARACEAPLICCKESHPGARRWLGWLLGAKDEKDTPLEKRYSSCFDEMVRPEVVCLGLQYQAGGEFCFFVAVAGNDKDYKEFRMSLINVGMPLVEECRPEECDSHENMGFGLL